MIGTDDINIVLTRVQSLNSGLGENLKKQNFYFESYEAIKQS